MSADDYVTADVVLLLPPPLRDLAVRVGDSLATRMQRSGHPSAFRPGQPYPGRGPHAVCEPHVSLFMLRLHRDDVDDLRAALQKATKGLAAPEARGAAWRHNPQGAPEIHFESSPAWRDLQQAVVGAAEPLRRGLRELDPAGVSPAATIERLRRDDPASPQLGQLERYGYDEIADEFADRFSPHVTVAWPRQEHRVDLTGVPEPAVVSGRLSRLAVYGMAPHGTCVEPLMEIDLTDD